MRRALTHWAGVWTDMVVEQDMMRPFKAQGGLTRGRGLTKSVVSQRVGRMPAAIRVCTSVEEFCGMYGVTSDQHVDLRASRNLARKETSPTDQSSCLAYRTTLLSTPRMAFAASQPALCVATL